jgi:hypothetical protein
MWRGLWFGLVWAGLGLGWDMLGWVEMGVLRVGVVEFAVSLGGFLVERGGEVSRVGWFGLGWMMTRI